MGHCGSCARRVDGNSAILAPMLLHTEQTQKKDKNRKVQLRPLTRVENTIDAMTAKVTSKPKTLQDKEHIRDSLNSHFIFKNLSEENIQVIIKEMKHYSLREKQIIFSQGDLGNNYFVIASGKVEVIVNGKSRGYLQRGASFGELALLHDSPRTATIKTITKTTLWGITRMIFRSALQSISAQKYYQNKEFIESVPIFKSLTDEQKEGLLGLLVGQEFHDKQRIVVEGDPGDLFYIIKDGKVSCSCKGIEIRKMGPGQFFGEQAMLYNTERTATVTAIGTTTVLSLDRNSLDLALGGSVQKIIYKNSFRIAIERSLVLRDLSSSQIEALTEIYEIYHYRPGESVIPKGTERGSYLWVILKGGLQCVESEEDINICQCLGDDDLDTPSGLYYESEFISTLNSDIAVINKARFELTIGGKLSTVLVRNAATKVLFKVPLLQNLPVSTLEQLSKVLQVKHYEGTIFRQGDPGNSFFIIKKGKVDILKDGHWIKTVGKNDYFGERSILLNERRSASVVANREAICWVLAREDFLDLVEVGLRSQLQKRLSLQHDNVILKNLNCVSLLGSGNFGNVFLTSSNSTHFYALKTISMEKVSKMDLYGSLLLERRIMLQLDHPFIVKLVKTFKDMNRVYFLMEYVHGKDLFDVLRSMNSLSEKDSKFYTACLLLILEHLHERKILYRDLKPENIMIDEEGYPKLIDFGVSTQIQSRTFTIVGTPHYMAPEVISGSGYDMTADYWSLGILLYEFVCGKLPFGNDDDDPFHVYEQIIRAKLEFPRALNLGVKIMSMIQKLLNPEPALRGNVHTIKQHRWLYSVNWDNLLGKLINPPYVPKLPSPDSKTKGDIFEIIAGLEKKQIGDSACYYDPPPEWNEEF